MLGEGLVSSDETYDDTSRHYDRTRVAVGVEIGQMTFLFATLG